MELHGVRAAYGRIEVLHGVNFAVGAGQVFALLGPNGAGKSTTLNVCAGLLPPTSGAVRFGGRPLEGLPPDRLARLGVCLIPEGRGVFPSLTVRDNLHMMTFVGVSRREVEAKAYERFPRLKERRSQLAGTLSGGEQQMLALARALVTNPALLLLDELSMGLAPLIVDELYEVVRQIAALGVSIVLVEQFARSVLGVADQAGIMLHGRVQKIGAPNELEAELSAAYLGG
jgi:branched-chain amino acid transport system ATP-binding protein